MYGDATTRSLSELSGHQAAFMSTRPSPLFGIYELRPGDAHLPSSEIDDALSKARVDQAAPFVEQGAQLIYGAAYSLHFAAEALK